MADYTTALGQVRLLTADLGSPPVLEDDELNGFLTMNGYTLAAPDFKSQMVQRSAADVLDATATSEVLLSKKIRTQDLTTDGPAVAAELRKQAQVLRDKADRQDEIDGTGEESLFAFVPFEDVRGAELEERRL